MKKPELTDLGWLGPRDEMDRASHRFGRCSECYEIICVENGPSTLGQTSERLLEAFRKHSDLAHIEAAKPSPKQILSVRCPTCGAKPGEKCELSTGLPRTNPHRDRRLIAKD
jgi:hypothetical protein